MLFCGLFVLVPLLISISLWINLDLDFPNDPIEFIWRRRLHPVEQGPFSRGTLREGQTPMGEVGRDALRLDFDHAIRLEFMGPGVR